MTPRPRTGVFARWRPAVHPSFTCGGSAVNLGFVSVSRVTTPTILFPCTEETPCSGTVDGRRSLALFLSFTLVAAACGGDDVTIDDTGPAAPVAPAAARRRRPRHCPTASTSPTCTPSPDRKPPASPTGPTPPTIAAELGSTTEFPDEPLTVAGPGPESGTYDTYIEFISDDFAEERGVESGVRTDYQSSPNDNVIVQNLESARRVARLGRLRLLRREPGQAPGVRGLARSPTTCPAPPRRPRRSPRASTRWPGRCTST